MEEQEIPVVIVGSGPAGLAAAACLAALRIPSLVLEKDDCVAPLWRKRTYDCLRLHLSKDRSELPHFPHPPATPTFVSRDGFLRYLDGYADRFGVRPLLRRLVESAAFDEGAGKWRVAARNLESGKEEEYEARYLVVASGQNGAEVVPELPGMESFGGAVMHSSRYRSGKGFEGKDVLVVGGGNSGMEIALDLHKSGARSSIVVRSKLHLVTREIWSWGLFLLKFLSVNMVDTIMLLVCKFKFGDTSKYGIQRPSKGPFYLKLNTPVYPVIDTGTFQKIKDGEIQVLPSLRSIKGNSVTFADGKVHHFDAIILATGYKSTVKNWLKGDDFLFGDDGMCKQKHQNYWKGQNGLYCTGFARKGLYGCAVDSLNIAEDINGLMNKSGGQVSSGRS
ncbi:putative indole-3-pyruvate monooxygenase YUCCA10 [Iris pallida]|uniref:Flavin-containing monooxygenase n=1 Tax=Iris pallida TaxID=29817 RepID=A0AAX6G0B9_IRIPA|nr:putative indole-3-pyruvate monooxygenase YUCCA10 [Iris pallida]